MLQTQFVPSLMKWGVSPQADLVYRTLITFGPWSVDSISRSLEMRTRQVISALDELTALGAALPDRASDGDQRVWASRAPAQVLPLLRDRHRRSTMARHRLHRSLTRLSLPSIMADVAHFPHEGVRTFPNRAVSRLRYAELLDSERHEHLSMNPEPAFDNATIKQVAPLGRKMMARGLTFLSLGVPASAEDESDWFDDEMVSHGMEYRELPELPGKLTICDRTTAYVPPDPSESDRGAWEITDPRLVADLRALFLQHWALAKDPGRDWTPPPGLTPRENTIVMLLAKGHTDASIANKLDISVRTIAYTLSGLMERYDVVNRFQLGLRLGAEAAQHARTGEQAAASSDEEQHR